jgi:hypothetical protein
VYFKESSELPVEPTADRFEFQIVLISEIRKFSDVFCTASCRTWRPSHVCPMAETTCYEHSGLLSRLWEVQGREGL